MGVAMRKGTQVDETYLVGGFHETVGGQEDWLNLHEMKSNSTHYI